MGSYSRVRSVKLKRKSPEDPFGFTLRGGQEHGTGIFVSSITNKSVAHKQGLKVGDQILRVNGFPLSSSTHKECLAVISARSHINLKIRRMIPVREPGEPLTWFLVENTNGSPTLDTEASSAMKMTLEEGHHRHQLLLPRRSDTSSSHRDPDSQGDNVPETIFINTNGQSGLGCCICRGPPEKPGIFVQSTKSNGVAREAGLRPGDQILECNGHSFRDVQFPEAIYHLKAKKELHLLVMKGGAGDLFPGESSGYNSSASSVNGETITSHVSVGSENSSSNSEVNLEDVLRTVQISNGGGGTDEGRNDVILDRNMEWEEVEQVWRSAKKEALIIQIKGEDPIQEQIRNKERQLSLERKNLEEEQRKLQEEAQKLEMEKLKFEEEKRNALAQQLQRTELDLRTSPVASNDESNSGHLKHSNLAGALSNEIMKRSTRRELLQRQEAEEVKPPQVTGNEIPTNSAHFPPVDDVKRRQHEQLIEEFKRAHRKMFQPSPDESGGTDENGGPVREERASFRAKRIQKEFEHTRKMVQNHVAGIVRQAQLRIERRHQEVLETDREIEPIEKPKGRAPQPPQFPDGRRSVATVTTKLSPQISRSTQIPVPSAIRKPSKPSLPPEKNLGEPVRQKVQSRSGKLHHHVEFSDRPESPSPDYSNSPSPELSRRSVYRRPEDRKPKSIITGILKT